MKKYKIVHLADIHIRNDERHEEYQVIFDRLYERIKEENPDRIAVVGDTLDNFIRISNEAKIFAGNFLNRLSELTEKVVVTIGNHEIRKTDLKRTNSIEVVVKLINNPKILYLNKSGFFEDEDIMWVNYSHIEKKILPWRDVKHTKKKDKVYIGLFHDPVYGCKLPNGMAMEKSNLVKLSDFKKNDCNLLGDIHLRQYFDETTAFCGSLIQQTHGELVDEHGGIIWEIDGKDITHTDFNIPNEYNFITFKTDEGFDYDDIDFDHELANENTNFKVQWKDLSVNFNNENENKIKDYFKDKWNSAVKIERNKIYTNIVNGKKLTESLNINDKKIQQDIFREYLELNKFEEEFINEIIDLDDIIDGRLDRTNEVNNVKWNVDKFWLDNFKSYKYAEIDWSNLQGIIQIDGENEDGKTTIFDALSYILKGTTLSTNKLGGGKREKNQDNTYINNKRDLNYCSGGAVIDIDGEKFTIFRKTTRTLNKKGEVNKASTILEYYKGTEMSDDNKEVGEGRVDTQRKIDAVIGEFSDFIRLSLTNSENLNYLLSMDRATFIDSIVRDAGYDVFEKKLDIFKKYKTELTKNNITIDLSKSKENLEDYKKEFYEYKESHDSLKLVIKKLVTDIKKLAEDKDSETKKLHHIDDSISNLNVDDINIKLEEYKTVIDRNKVKQVSNSKIISGLKTKYDEEKLNNGLKGIKKIDDEILNLKLNKSQFNSDIEKQRSNIDKVSDKIIQFKEKEINSQKSNLNNIDNDIKNIIKDKKNDYDKKIQSKEHEIQSLSKDIKSIKEKGIEIKKVIKELEDSKETKICPTCMREYDDDKHVDDKIEEHKAEIEDLFEDVKFLIESEKDNKTNLDEIKLLKENIDSDGVILKSIEKLKNQKTEINNICENIENNIFTDVPTLLENINNVLAIKKKSKEKILSLEESIKDNDKLIRALNLEKDELQKDLINLEEEKKEVQLYEKLNYENKELKIGIDTYKLNIEKAKISIDKYYDQLTYIKNNKIYNEKISQLEIEIDSLTSEKDEKDLVLTNIIKDSAVVKNQIVSLKENISKYKEQIKQDELLKEYMKCVHRDGIPTYLLNKSRDMINIELENILSNVDFAIYFDESLNLKFYDDGNIKNTINLITASGMQRTFGVMALRMALRTINNKSKPNFMLFDEIMGKLKGKSIPLFNTLLAKIKTKIDKILIIEHNHTISSDYIITVKKDKNFISSLTIE